jgi:hypothetical protein
MSLSCAQWRGDIGACIIGAVDSRARARVSRHLAVCAGCRAEYDDLAPVRAWLGLLPLPARPEPGSPQQPGPARPDLPFDAAPVPRSPRESRARPAPPAPGLLAAIGLRRRSLLAAAAAAAAAVAVLAALVISGPAAPSFRAVNSATGVTGHAQLHGTPAGTEIDLTASGLPAGKRCILVAVAPGGADIAGTWDATYDGSARITGTSAFPASRLRALRIESDTGLPLLTIRIRR